MTRSPGLFVLQHGDSAGPALLGEVLDTAHVAAEVVRLHLGEPLPTVAELGALVVLGGSMGAYDEEEHPHLVAEKRLLREAVAEGVPVLGICLGCQLLADALGGSAFLAPKLEARFAACELTADGAVDPVVRHLARPTLSLHQDTWEPPPGVPVLATSDRYPQAFRSGSGLGIQPHPEVTPELATAWVEEVGRERIAADAGDPGRLLAAIRRDVAGSRRTASDLFGAWLEEAKLVSSRPSGPHPG